MRIEPLEGRALMSYLAIHRGQEFIQVQNGDVRREEPIYGNGLGVNPAPHFYSRYTGPQRPELNGLRADAFVDSKYANLVLIGTVAGPIVARPTTAAQEATYEFAIDRGGSPYYGPFPGLSKIRFDALVIVSVARRGTTASLTLNDPVSNLPVKTPTALSASSVVIRGSSVQITIPLTSLPSTGKAFDQWAVNFFTRNPNQKQDIHSYASFTPSTTEFQVFVARPKLGYLR